MKYIISPIVVSLILNQSYAQDTLAVQEVPALTNLQEEEAPAEEAPAEADPPAEETPASEPEVEVVS